MRALSRRGCVCQFTEKVCLGRPCRAGCRFDCEVFPKRDCLFGMDLLMKIWALFIHGQAYIWFRFLLGTKISHLMGQVGLWLIVRGIIFLTVWDCIENLRFFQRNFMGRSLVAPDMWGARQDWLITLQIASFHQSGQLVISVLKFLGMLFRSLFQILIL